MSARRFGRAPAGMSLVESVLALFIVGFAIQMVSALGFSSAVLKEAEDRSSVDAFLRDALDGAVGAATEADRGGDPVGFAYGVGRQAADASGPARQGIGALGLSPADVPLSGGITNVALLRTYAPSDADLEAYVRVDSGASGAWEAGLAFGYRDGANHYRLTLGEASLELAKVADGQKTVLAMKATAGSLGAWRRLRVVTSGHALTAYLDGILAFSVDDADFSPARLGLIGLGAVRFRSDDVQLVSSGGSASLGFEDVSPQATAAAFVINAPYHLSGFRTASTVDAYDASLPSLKRVSVTAEWTSKGHQRTLSLESLKDIR
ncbi:MAG: hypothetical protein AAB554_05615 [Patescibacteria group bacterium]